MKQLLFFAILFFHIANSCNGNNGSKYTTIDGFTMSTTYHIVHDNASTQKIQAGIEAVLLHIDSSLSAYNPQSILSKINRNEQVVVDSFFIEVFQRSCEINIETNGAFDISGSPLFNAWGFGFKNKESLNQTKVDSLKKLVGMNHLRLKGKHIVKDNPRVTINANAIAKGFGVDAVARYLEQSGVQNYIVEIGGEIRCKGKNSRGVEWTVGIDKPFDGNFLPGEDMQAILQFSGKSLATSGNYRRFYEESGKKYAHTIDPVSGYPVSHNLLSATVIASDCMSADAYATAFMVMGVDKTKDFLSKHPELGVLLIYDDHGKYVIFATDDVKKMLRGY